MIIGIDNGYGNMKSARRCFPTAIVKELEARGMSQQTNKARIHLAVGLPLKWVKSQRDSFKEYLLRNRSVEVRYKNRLYQLEITGCTVMPQCYSAVAENLKCFKGITLLADIGNGTMNLMYLNNGRPIESKSWTEKLGVFQCFQRIHNEVQNNTGDNLMDDVIENILRSGEIDLPESHAKYVRTAIHSYVEEIFQKLRDHEYNEKLMKVYFMGGGAGIVEKYGLYNPDTTTFDHDIRANAKGYEYYCYMILKSQRKMTCLICRWDFSNRIKKRTIY